jgi:ubiquinone/menaquinone biosynthesis C-methylase UbiE
VLLRRVSQIVLAAVAIGAAVVVLRHVRRHATGHRVAGGVLMSDAGSYDILTRVLYGSRNRSIGSDIASTVSPDARILEVGSGPGHLSVRLAADHGLDVIGLDLDPAMVERAQANATRSSADGGRRPRFVVGDVAALPFDDASFDLVSTFSMHHWSEPQAGLNEIARVLRPGGRALIWDFKPGFWLFHAHAPDPEELVRTGPLRVISVRPWRWPWRLSLARRLELARPT